MSAPRRKGPGRVRAAFVPLAIITGLAAGCVAGCAWAGPRPPAGVDPIAWSAAAAGPADALVILREKADLSVVPLLPGREDRALFVVLALRAAAAHAQGPLLGWLAGQGVPYRAFWIVDAVWVHASRDQMRAIAARPEVERVAADPAIANDLASPPTDAAAPKSLEWNIDRTNAPIAWAEGHAGEGIVVAGQDTGVRWTHRDLIRQYRGWDGVAASHDFNWHDAIHAPAAGGPCGPDSPVPCDDSGHGTHTLATAVGSDGSSNEVGMAPRAQWIACRNMDQGVGTPDRYLECFEFMLAPYAIGADPATGDPLKAPDVTTNSWVCPVSEGCPWDILQAAVEAQAAAGIVTVAAAGNSGPGCGSVGEPPAIYAAAYTVGATDSSDSVAGFSSRGPAASTGLLKPDIMAPGVSVRSAAWDADDAHATASGTSMAAPHVAGAVALLWSARPAYRHHVAETRELFDRTARRLAPVAEACGGDDATGPNATWGHGLVDVARALAEACDTTETRCGDGFDEDCDLRTDCDDPDCFGSACAEGGHCSDGLDQDGDMLIDCDDPDCATDVACDMDADDDGVPNASDCSRFDPGVFAAAPEVRMLMVRHAGPVATVSWEDLSSSCGSDVVYDVASDLLSQLHVAGIAAGTCLSRGQTGLEVVDPRPALGDGRWYLARGVTSCGPAEGQGWGADSAGRQRPGCP